MSPKELLATSNRLGLQTLFPVQPIRWLHLSAWSASLASPTARPTTPAADFSCAVGKDHSSPSGYATHTRSPEVSSNAFLASLLNLQPETLDRYGLCDPLSARPISAASYPVSVRQVASLFHAAFRPRLAATPLRFTNTSSLSDCVRDFHPQAFEHARHTTKSLRLPVSDHRGKREPTIQCTEAISVGIMGI